MFPCISNNVLLLPHICSTNQITSESLGVSLLAAAALLVTDGPSLWLLFFFFFYHRVWLLWVFAVQYTPKKRKKSKNIHCANPLILFVRIRGDKAPLNCKSQWFWPLRKLSFMVVTAPQQGPLLCRAINWS